MSLTKQTLIDTIRRNSNSSHELASSFVDDFFEIMCQSLEDGESIKIPGFGNFILREKNPRMGRNPKTLKEHIISARKVVSFRCSAKLRDAVRN